MERVIEMLTNMINSSEKELAKKRPDSMPQHRETLRQLKQAVEVLTDAQNKM